MAKTTTRTVPLAVHDLALPSPRYGSIEVHSGYGPLPEQGQQVHAEVQAKRLAADPTYAAEVPLQHTFTAGKYAFRVSGRVDGWSKGPPLVCEELKSAFDAPQLLARLRAEPEHPYWLQLLTYAYMHSQATGTTPPLCRLTVISSRTREETSLERSLDRPVYEAWLERRLGELAAYEGVLLRRRQRRQRQASQLRFPFASVRPGQDELMQLIANAPSASKYMLIEAPTGMGKTLGVTLPALRSALSRGAPLLYLTPKNSQHGIAQQAAAQLGSPRTLTLTAKARICMKEQVLCNPQYCEYARGYYDKVAQHDLINKVARQRRVTEATLRSYAERYEVCPAELGLEAAAAFDLLIGDYNYIISTSSLGSRIAATMRGKDAKPVAVIDEAHNLYARAMDNLSASLSRRELERLGAAAASRIGEPPVLRETLAFLQSFGHRTREVPLTKPLVAALARLTSQWTDLTGAYLASDADITAADPVLALTGYWRSFATGLEQALADLEEVSGKGRSACAGPDQAQVAPHSQLRALGASEQLAGLDEVRSAAPSPPPMPAGSEALHGVYTCLFERTGGDDRLRLLCCDASAHLAACWSSLARVIGFSATLRPFEFYARLSGMDQSKLVTATFASPFPKEHRKVLVIPQVSTKLRDRAHNVAKIADATSRMCRVRPGNYAVFFPSFQFLGDVAARLDMPGWEILQQPPGMSQQAVRQTLERLRTPGAPALMLAVQGGSLAEGIDFPGEQLLGAIIVGPALPNFDVPREVLRAYYQRTYGRGEDYAYIYPAMTKVVQAAGRVIRTDSDRGLIVLMDARFTEPRFSELMPYGWYEHSVQELVSTGILSEIDAFWRGGAAPPAAADRPPS